MGKLLELKSKFGGIIDQPKQSITEVMAPLQVDHYIEYSTPWMLQKSRESQGPSPGTPLELRSEFGGYDGRGKTGRGILSVVDNHILTTTGCTPLTPS